MAFTQANLSLMAYTGATAEQNHLWYYVEPADDSWEDANYFNDVAATMKEGDIILGSDGQARYVSDITTGDVTTTAVNS